MEFAVPTLILLNIHQNPQKNNSQNNGIMRKIKTSFIMPYYILNKHIFLHFLHFTINSIKNIAPIAHIRHSEIEQKSSQVHEHETVFNFLSVLLTV